MSIAAPSRRTRLLASAALASGIIVGASAATAVGAWNAPRQHGPSETVPRIGIRFEPNVGQAPGRVAFVARGGDATLFLGRRGATLSRPGGAVRVGFAGALRVDPEAAGRPAGTSSYFLGDDPAAWRSGVRASTRVAYPDLWSGVRMTFRGRANAVEYRFRVAPGADASAIGLTFGDAAVHVADDGGLRASSPGGVTLRQSPAVLFQRVGDRRVPVSGRFVVRPGGEVGLAVGDYDPTVPLVVDPSIRLSTFFGGGGTDIAWAVDLGSNSTFMAGETRSLDFPTKAGAIDRMLGGSCDAFLVQLNVHKLDPVLNATYLGGGGCDRALGLDVGSNGAATLVGVTDSVDLPTTAGAYRSTYGGGAHDAWVAQVSPNGSSLTSSTYLGGAGDDGAEDVAVDAGVAYVTGSTTSSDFPSTVGAPPGGGSDAFVTALYIPGTGLVFSRLAGGTADEAGTGIAVAAGGAASVAGVDRLARLPDDGGRRAAGEGGRSRRLRHADNPGGRRELLDVPGRRGQ